MNAREMFFDALSKTGKETLTRKEAIKVAEELGLSAPHYFINNDEYRLSRGMYKVPSPENSKYVVQNVVPLKANPVAVDHRKVGDQSEHRDLVTTFEKNFTKLRAEYNLFSSKWM